MSPIDLEVSLRKAVTELTRSEQALKDARNTETDAEITYQRAYRRALLSRRCPRVERGGVTVAERDAWVQQECAQEWEAWQVAKTACKAAEDHQRMTRDVTSVYQTIAGLTKTAMSLAGAAS